MSNIAAVIFDMDGILLDTEKVCLECWSRAGQELGFENIVPVYRSCIGRNVKGCLDTITAAYPDFTQEQIDVFYERTRDLFHVVEEEQGLDLMKGVVETLERLKGEGYRLAVASSTRWEAVSRQLTRAGIINYFETITTGDKVLHSKPAPDIYLMACNSLNLEPSACIAVEDSPNGVRSAVAAGIKCIMVPDQIAPDEEMKKIAFQICNSLLEIKIS